MQLETVTSLESTISTVAPRCTLQSPPDGTSYCSKKVARVSVSLKPSMLTPFAPSTRKIAASTGATMSFPGVVEFG